MYLSCRVSSLPPPNQQKENKTTQLFHTRTYSANSYTLNIDNTRHTHTTILQLYMYIPKCLCHFLGVALCTGTCMYSSHGNDVEYTLCDKFIRTCTYVRTCTYMYIIVARLIHACLGSATNLLEVVITIAKLPYKCSSFKGLVPFSTKF